MNLNLVENNFNKNSTIFLQDFRSEPCQVCGENASGWHCGSITCEACKKFFLRSVNEEYLKYKCIRDRKCLITRTTRTQCQYCRYAKCIEVGMKISDENPNPKIEEIFRQIPCVVCQDPSSGIHFGATTCEGCKGFFRRTIRERVPQHYKCSEQNNCEINPKTRNGCRACRFRKCLAAGMSIEGSRIGRQSNLFKHKMVEMQRRGLIRSQILNLLPNNSNNFNARRKNSFQNRNNFLQEKLDKNLLEQISQLQYAFEKNFKDFCLSNDENDDLWSFCVNQLNDYTGRVNNFAEQIRGFQSLTVEDKNLLVHSSIHSVVLVCLCFENVRFRSINNQTCANYFNLRINSSLAQQLNRTLPNVFDLNRLFNAFETQIFNLQLDEKEIATFLSLILVSAQNSKFNDFQQIERIQEDLFCTLYDYMSVKRSADDKDFFLLTVQLPSILQMNNFILSNIANLEYSLSPFFQ